VAQCEKKLVKCGGARMEKQPCGLKKEQRAAERGLFLGGNAGGGWKKQKHKYGGKNGVQI